MTKTRCFVCLLAAATLALPILAGPISFDTGPTNGLMASASRPASSGKFEIESADDFVLTSAGSISSATFTGLLVGALPTDVSQVRVEIYRVFPKDSTSPPSGSVPTRANSPSDVGFEDRDSASAGLSFSTMTLAGSFTALNSIQPGGIHPIPNTTTGGNGPVSGTEVLFTVSFATPFDLPADHYFFVPQVAVSGGEFYWLSGQRPTLPPFAPDLQSWTRDEGLAPDWLRIGTDIVGPAPAGGPAPTFNGAFSIAGKEAEAVPEPSTFALAGVGLALAALSRRAASRARS
jgi:hypothetical protein